MDGKSEITVVIPNYNGADYIAPCLDSLLAGSLVPQIIVVDNGSGDGGRELVGERYASRGVRLVCFEENKGFCRAVNRGVELSETEFVILLNNDTVVERDFVQELLRAMKGGKDIFSAGAKLLSLREPDKIDDAGDEYCALGWAYARGKGRNRELYGREEEVYAVCAGAAAYRRSLLMRLGGFDPLHFAYLEDIDIGYRARIHGYRNVYVPRAVVYHAGSAASGSRYNEFKIRLSSRNSVYLIYKNMPWLQIGLNLPFLIAGFAAKAVFFALKGYGGVYMKGLAAGVKLCASPEGRRRKLRFRGGRLLRYVKIQLDLWVNILRRFT